MQNAEFKSHIDWNELFPHLPKKLRDAMLLEAIALMGGMKRPHQPIMRRISSPRVKVAPVAESATAPVREKTQYQNGLRTWATNGDGKQLAIPGRVYRIIPGALPFTKGPVAEFWARLAESKRSEISYEAIRAAVGNDREVASSYINQMFRTGRIEVLPLRE
jgi:hypothetical protein